MIFDLPGGDFYFDSGSWLCVTWQILWKLNRSFDHSSACLSLFYWVFWFLLSRIWSCIDFKQENPLHRTSYNGFQRSTFRHFHAQPQTQSNSIDFNAFMSTAAVIFRNNENWNFKFLIAWVHISRTKLTVLCLITQLIFQQQWRSNLNKKISSFFQTLCALNLIF